MESRVALRKDSLNELEKSCIEFCCYTLEKIGSQAFHPAAEERLRNYLFTFYRVGSMLILPGADRTRPFITHLRSDTGRTRFAAEEIP